MATPPKKLDRSQELPCKWVKKLARGNRVIESILSHAHVLQIVDDHHAMFLEATTEADRRKIQLRLRRQLALAGLNFVGLELTVHGTVAILTDPLHGGSLIVLGIILMYATIQRGH